MSVANSFSCIRGSSPAATYSSAPSSSASSTTSNACFTFRPSYPCKASNLVIKNSLTDGPLRRPVSPPSLTPPPRPAPVAPAPKPADEPLAGVEDSRVVTLEFQRVKAKELQSYFKQKKLEDATSGPSLGFNDKNEIINGRWAMFGFAVGMLTEYATGSDFVDQVKILLANFGILDLD